MKRLALLLLLATVAGCGPAGERKGPGAASPLAVHPLKAGIDPACLKENLEGETPDPRAWIALGMLDQVKGDLTAAFEKYKRAWSADLDVAVAPIDLTLIGDVIWIQNEVCPVPVPVIPTSMLLLPSAPHGTHGPEIVYPPVIADWIHSEGNARVVAFIAADGKPFRIAVTDASSGPPEINRKRDPGDEAAERLVARVQFALTSFDELRDFTFVADAGGTIWESKQIYFPPKDIYENLPGGRGASQSATSSSKGN